MIKVYFSKSNTFTVKKDRETLLAATHQFDNTNQEMRCQMTKKDIVTKLRFERSNHRIFSLSAKYDIHENNKHIGSLSFRWNGSGLLKLAQSDAHHQTYLISKTFSGGNLLISDEHKHKLFQIEGLGKLLGGNNSEHSIAIFHQMDAIAELIAYAIFVDHLGRASDDR